jgi:hypothetical protein
MSFHTGMQTIPLAAERALVILTTRVSMHGFNMGFHVVFLAKFLVAESTLVI